MFPKENHSRSFVICSANKFSAWITWKRQHFDGRDKKHSKIDWIISIQIRYRNRKEKDSSSKDYLMPGGNKTWNRLQNRFRFGFRFRLICSTQFLRNCRLHCQIGGTLNSFSFGWCVCMSPSLALSDFFFTFNWRRNSPKACQTWLMIERKKEVYDWRRYYIRICIHFVFD